eukprot:TRINITY_DN17668_c0_g1_i1.p1 TRINITY_DN17668_c0_g1~~TRINITY_DN17668_c0_g1_i1.p1  ORF type:complete len:341 (+),score=8.72 TRINITY_DN17668_c0_g1_i1:71-1093(+)
MLIPRLATNAALIYSGIVFYSMLLLSSVLYNLWIEKREPFEPAVGVLRWVYQSFSSDLIEDIVPHNKCEGDYEDLIYGYFSGTIAGHLCKDALVLGEEDVVGPRNCQYAHCNVCINLDAHAPSPITTWKSGKLCAKKIKNWSFPLEDPRRKNATCAKGKRLCTNSQICVPSTMQCPITKLQLIRGNGSANNSEITPIIYWNPHDERVESLSEENPERHEPLLLVYSRANTGAGPVLSLNVSIEQPPCLSVGYTAPRHDNSSYVLSKNREVGCDKYGIDKNADVLDDWDERTVYDLNHLYDKLTFDNPIYQELIHLTRLVLSVRRRASCLLYTSPSPRDQA